MSNPSANDDLVNRRAAVALYALCQDGTEAEKLTHLLATLPSSYRLPERLVTRLGVVVGYMRELRDEA